MPATQGTQTVPSCGIHERRLRQRACASTALAHVYRTKSATNSTTSAGALKSLSKCGSALSSCIAFALPDGSMRRLLRAYVACRQRRLWSRWRRRPQFRQRAPRHANGIAISGATASVQCRGSDQPRGLACVGECCCNHAWSASPGYIILHSCTSYEITVARSNNNYSYSFVRHAT